MIVNIFFALLFSLVVVLCHHIESCSQTPRANGLTLLRWLQKRKAWVSVKPYRLPKAIGRVGDSLFDASVELFVIILEKTLADGNYQQVLKSRITWNLTNISPTSLNRWDSLCIKGKWEVRYLPETSHEPHFNLTSLVSVRKKKYTDNLFVFSTRKKLLRKFHVILKRKG